MSTLEDVIKEIQHQEMKDAHFFMHKMASLFQFLDQKKKIE